MKSNLLMLILTVVIGVNAAESLAVPITFELSATGNGSLGGQPFSGADFTITSTANTENVTGFGPGIFRLDAETAVVSVAGIGFGAFSNLTANVDNQNLGRVGFSDFDEGAAVLFVDHAAFLSYDLTSSIGPLSGPPAFNFGRDFPTSNGNFSLTFVSEVTFRAIVVPEPASAIVLIAGGSMLAGAVARRRRDRRTTKR
jgi:hypothetical protein